MLFKRYTALEHNNNPLNTGSFFLFLIQASHYQVTQVLINVFIPFNNKKTYLHTKSFQALSESSPYNVFLYRLVSTCHSDILSVIKGSYRIGFSASICRTKKCQGGPKSLLVLGRKIRVVRRAMMCQGGSLR
jgi:hypothetical protein